MLGVTQGRADAPEERESPVYIWLLIHLLIPSRARGLTWLRAEAALAKCHEPRGLVSGVQAWNSPPRIKDRRKVFFQTCLYHLFTQNFATKPARPTYFLLLRNESERSDPENEQ